MSVKIMTEVFADSDLKSMEKLVMLALADNANDEGYCYPSINNIVEKTSMSNKTIIKHINNLIAIGKLKSKKRNSKNTTNGGKRLSTIYVVYPKKYFKLLDEDLANRFNENDSQSVEVTPYSQSVKVTSKMGSQSVTVTPKPSLYNHQLFNKLNNKQKESYLEYINLRTKMKLKTTMSIHERLLNKFFEYGANIEIIQTAICNNWKDFYPLRQNKNHNNNFLDIQAVDYSEDVKGF